MQRLMHVGKFGNIRTKDVLRRGEGPGNGGRGGGLWADKVKLCRRCAAASLKVAEVRTDTPLVGGHCPMPLHAPQAISVRRTPASSSISM